MKRLFFLTSLMVLLTNLTGTATFAAQNWCGEDEVIEIISPTMGFSLSLVICGRANSSLLGSEFCVSSFNNNETNLPIPLSDLRKALERVKYLEKKGYFVTEIIATETE
ncbi:hypothetical protein HGA64_04455 [Candidatus Falkowbacteria bacterium]|nr:hypothetical protein [Candidatus Falkowbacteria bacterium]